MNVKAISNNTFLEHQHTYLQPAILRVYQRKQKELIRQSQGKKLVFGGDGRADSPGHSAKYGSYALMDMESKKVIGLQLVQSNEVTSSNAMEKEGLKRGLEELTETGIEVGTIVTDRHTQVAKWMRETYPKIDHRYDVWHIAKGVLKKLRAISKLKDCEVILLWKQSIINHIYWAAASTPDGDGKMMVAKFNSMLNHIRDVHVHEGIYPACAHDENYPAREWLREGTKPYEKLADELSKTCLLNDLKKMSHLAQTSSVESFHSVLLYWCPKMLAFSYAGMKCRMPIKSKSTIVLHSPRSAMNIAAHLNDFTNHVDVPAAICGGKRAMVLLVDGGSDFNVNHGINERYYGRFFRDTGLDTLLVTTYCPGDSALNPVEHLWGPCTKALKGVYLPSTLSGEDCPPALQVGLSKE